MINIQAYVNGVDEHFCFSWFKNRKEANDWLQKEIFLYNICYFETKVDFGVLTDTEFKNKFIDEKYSRTISWRRLGNDLRARIFELKYSDSE